MWTESQLIQHKQTATLLDKIKNDVFELVKQPKITEYEVQQFIVKEFRANNLVPDKDPPIVAFGQNTSHVHYFPTKQTCITLPPNSPILIDIWARPRESHAPFADITWMGYNGTIDPEFRKIYRVVIEARDTAVSFLKEQLQKGIIPTGQQVDWACRQIIEESGYGDYFLHTTGHSLGTSSPHGLWAAIRSKNTQPLHKMLGYTIEPGIYLAGKFGARSEINFYIDEDHSLQITTPVQKELIV